LTPACVQLVCCSRHCTKAHRIGNVLAACVCWNRMRLIICVNVQKQFTVTDFHACSASEPSQKELKALFWQRCTIRRVDVCTASRWLGQVLQGLDGSTRHLLLSSPVRQGTASGSARLDCTKAVVVRPRSLVWARSIGKTVVHKTRAIGP
jgi:hypothetical protein